MPGRLVQQWEVESREDIGGVSYNNLLLVLLIFCSTILYSSGIACLLMTSIVSLLLLFCRLNWFCPVIAVMRDDQCILVQLRNYISLLLISCLSFIIPALFLFRNQCCHFTGFLHRASDFVGQFSTLGNNFLDHLLTIFNIWLHVFFSFFSIL